MTYRKIYLWILAGSLAALVVLCVVSWHRVVVVTLAEGSGDPAQSLTVCFSSLRFMDMESGPPKAGFQGYTLPIPASLRAGDRRTQGYTGIFYRDRWLARISPDGRRYYSEFLDIPIWLPWLVLTGILLGALRLVQWSSGRTREKELAGRGTEAPGQDR